MAKTDPLSMIPDTSFKAVNVGKFAPKLNTEERCAVLALVRAGIRREVVAAAFGVDRRTVGHIANPSSLRYRETRNTYTNLGHDEFLKRYITEEVAQRVAKVSDAPVVEDTSLKVSSRANRMAGEHRVKPPQCEYEHHIEIAFMEVDGVKGWYYRDIDSDPDTWLHNGDDSRKTSHACYGAVLENLVDD